MPYYVKVTPEVRAQILPDFVKKNKAKDGNFLLFQSDLIGVDGNTLQERVDNVGGALLTPDECRAERLGTANPPAKCYTPKWYGGSDNTTEDLPEEQPTDTYQEDGFTPSEHTDPIQEVVIPPVIGDTNHDAEDDEDSVFIDDIIENQQESEVNNG